MTRKETEKEVKRKACSKCEKVKKVLEDYYLASSDLIYSDSRLPICKDCLESIVDFDNPYSVLGIMRMIDRPFLKGEYDGAKETAKSSGKNPFREYMRRLAMKQNRDLNYTHSQMDGLNLNIEDNNENQKKESKSFSFSSDPEMILKWGEGYTDLELQQLEKFHGDMTRANNINTPQHKAQLELLCKVFLEQNKALSEKRFGDFKNLNNQYNQILRDSGFRPIDKQGGDESSGIRTFSQIWEEIERDGFIKPTPIEENQDVVDRTIMYMGNYTRKLLNMNSLSEPPKDTPKVDSDGDE